MEWGKLLALKGHHHIMYKITPNSIRIVYKCIVVVENRWGVWRCVNHAQYRYMKRHLAHPTEAFLLSKQILGSLRMLATVLSNDSCSSSKRGFSFSTSWASLPVCHSSLQSSIIFWPTLAAVGVTFICISMKRMASDDGRSHPQERQAIRQ